MANEFIAIDDIPFYGVLAFTKGQRVDAAWVDAHPDESDGRVEAYSEEVAEEVTPGAYDPSSHTVDEVLAQLETAEPGEFDRIVAAEAAGKARKGITDFGQEA